MEWICKSKDLSVKFKYEDEKLYISELFLNGRNRAAETEVSLPSFYTRDNDVKHPFSWEFKRSFIKDNGFDLLFSDKTAGCKYMIQVKGRQDINGPVEFSAKLINSYHKDIRIYPEDIFSVGFSFEKAPVSWRIVKESGVAENVKWHLDPNVFFPGSGIYKDVLNEGVSVDCETNTLQDFNQGGMIPIIYLDGNTCGSYIAFEWASSCISAVGTHFGAKVSVNFRKNFNTNIPSGKEFVIPPVYIGVYDGDVDDGSNIFKRWFYLEKTPKTMLKDKNEPYVQIDVGQIPVDKAKDFGIQSIKWDYGWWSTEKITDKPEDIWKYHEGSWKCRVPGYGGSENGDMAKYGQMLKEKGLNWTVYVLLHDALKELEEGDELTSVGEHGHPEWFSNRKIVVCPVADLGNEDCVEYCKRKLLEFFVENNINTWRSDFEPIAFISDKQNRHDANGTDVQYWCSKGFYDIVDYILENIPGFRYESCSSGGSMKDFATMHRCTVFNNDDSANYNSLRTTFYDSSYCFPPSQLQAPVNPDTCCPDCERYYAGIGDKDFGFRAIIMGAVMLGSWCGRNKDGHLNHDLEAYYKEYLNLHNEKVKPLIREADLYHILPRPDGVHWDGMQYGCAQMTENRVGGACFLFKPTNEEGETKHINVRGLNPDFVYRASFYERKDQSFTATGRELMEKGFDCTIFEDCGSEIVFFEIV